MLPTAIACSAMATNTAKVAWAVHCRIASCAARVSVRTSGSGPSSRIEPASTNGTPCVTNACMIPAVTIPCCTAALMPPTRRIALMARMWRAWPPSTPSHELALLHATWLGDDEVQLRVEHDDAVHARQAGPAPRASSVHVGGEIGGGEKTVREHAVGRGGLEARVRRTRERRRVEVRRAILEARASGHRRVIIPATNRLTQPSG